MRILKLPTLAEDLEGLALGRARGEVRPHLVPPPAPRPDPLLRLQAALTIRTREVLELRAYVAELEEILCVLVDTDDLAGGDPGA